MCFAFSRAWNVHCENCRHCRVCLVWRFDVCKLAKLRLFKSCGMAKTELRQKIANKSDPNFERCQTGPTTGRNCGSHGARIFGCPLSTMNGTILKHNIFGTFSHKETFHRHCWNIGPTAISHSDIAFPFALILSIKKTGGQARGGLARSGFSIVAQNKNEKK